MAGRAGVGGVGFVSDIVNISILTRRRREAGVREDLDP